MKQSTSQTTAATLAHKLLHPLQGTLKCLLRDLVRTNSVAIPPHGNETPAQLVLRDFFLEHGIHAELYDTAFLATSKNPLVQKGRNYKGRKNLAVCISGTGRGKSLLLNGHMDTVPPGRVGWSASPWSGLSRNGRIYGRGSFDMKGGVVAQAAVACALKVSDARLGGDLLFESVVDEEYAGGGGTIAARLRGNTADACVISEGTQLEIFRATRGGFVVDLVLAAGDPSAYFSKAEVISPAIPLGRVLGWVDAYAKQRQKLKPRGAYASFHDPAPVQVLVVEANRLEPEIPLSVPCSAVVRVYIQFLPQEDVTAVIRQMQNSLQRFAKSDPFFRKYPIQWKPVLGNPLWGHELSANHPWTQCMVQSAGAVLKKTPVVTAAPYPCDAGLLHRDFGIPTLLFGPCGAGAHNPDEYVEFASVIQTAEVLLSSMLQWGNG